MQLHHLTSPHEMSTGAPAIDVRRAVVGELTEAGLSTRAIAPVVGVHHDTVARDTRRVVNTTPDPVAEPAEEGEANPGPGQRTREAGLSTRAIAPVVGVGKSTVDRDQVSHVGHLTPESTTPGTSSRQSVC